MNGLSWMESVEPEGCTSQAIESPPLCLPKLCQPAYRHGGLRYRGHTPPASCQALARTLPAGVAINPRPPVSRQILRREAERLCRKTKEWMRRGSGPEGASLAKGPAPVAAPEGLYARDLPPVLCPRLSRRRGSTWPHPTRLPVPGSPPAAGGAREDGLPGCIRLPSLRRKKVPEVTSER